MALAVLQLEELGGDGARLNIDTGTNRLYRLRVGRSLRHSNDADWVDEVTFESPFAENPAGGSPFGSATEVLLPRSRLQDGAAWVQLFSFKDRDGRATSWSDPVRIGSGATVAREVSSLPAMGRHMNRAAAFEQSRRIPCETGAERYATPASIDDVLGSVIKLAAPLVEQLLGGGTAGTPGSAATPNGGPDALGKVLAVLLKTILGGAPAQSAAPSVAKSLSTPANGLSGNRFRDAQYSQPFIFGIDDALIGSLAGPILQILPQLLNSANQAKVQMKQSDNKLMSDLMSDVSRRLLLLQIANSQPVASSAPELQRQLQQAAVQPAPAADGTATSSSLSLSQTGGDMLSSRATVGFQLADPLPWTGGDRLLFAKGSALRLNIQLVVGAPVPKNPLPKAIVRVALRSPTAKSILAEKVFKLKGVAANTVLPLEFAAAELAAVPANQRVEIFVEFRWRTAVADKTCKALGSREAWFINKYALRNQGSMTGPEVELTDMSRFRAFWNKVWDSPVLDTSAGSAKKYLWELDINAKYSLLLSAVHSSNGLMETRALKSADDPESLTARTAGRMKGGIEIAVGELNKLLPLWQGNEVLPAEKLEAFTTESFASTNAGEVVTRLKLDGKSGERGMVWAIPVFRLLQCTLATPAKVDENGQVLSVTEQPATFPVPVAVRMIGLKSKR